MRADRLAEATRPPDATALHAARVVVLSLLVLILLGWLARGTRIFFADGLRYISQARAIERGSGFEAVRTGVDHPAYPLAVAATHRAAWPRSETPGSWQSAAQWASVLAGVLLVLPVYLTARELHGDALAFPSTLLVYAVPVTGHVFADALSESTFLLFWTWGLWGALRFLRTGRPAGLLLAVTATGLAYLTRPEGLLLPAALLATLLIHVGWVARGLGRRVFVAGLVIGVGLAATVGPYVFWKGGLSDKPSVARLLGRAPKSDPLAVERQRPLEPGQSEARTYALAAKAVASASTGATTLPVFGLAVLGVLTLRPTGPERRQWTLVGLIVGASALALVRLHATGGYCTPRHALIPALLVIPLSVRGIEGALDALTGHRRWPLSAAGRSAVLAGLVVWSAPATLAPLNAGLGGYKDAGVWLSGSLGGADRVVDVTGWSHFYSGQGGYTFENLVGAGSDPDARWVVVRESHLVGPWWYCGHLRSLVDGLRPVREFRDGAEGRSARVLVFDRAQGLAVREERGAAAVVR